MLIIRHIKMPICYWILEARVWGPYGVGHTFNPSSPLTTPLLQPLYKLHATLISWQKHFTSPYPQITKYSSTKNNHYILYPCVPVEVAEKNMTHPDLLDFHNTTFHSELIGPAITVPIITPMIIPIKGGTQIPVFLFSTRTPQPGSYHITTRGFMFSDRLPRKTDITNRSNYPDTGPNQGSFPRTSFGEEEGDW